MVMENTDWINIKYIYNILFINKILLHLSKAAYLPAPEAKDAHAHIAHAHICQRQICLPAGRCSCIYLPKANVFNQH